MKKIFLAFLLLLISSAAFSQGDVIEIWPVADCKNIEGLWAIEDIKNVGGIWTIATGETCQLFASDTSGTDLSGIAQYSAQRYKGVIFDNDSGSGTVKLCDYMYFTLGSVTGDITTLDYYVEVWLLDGSDEFDSSGTPTGRSSAVQGNNGWSTTKVGFPLSSDITMTFTGTEQYAIAVKAIAHSADPTTQGAYDGSIHCAMMFHNDSGTQLTGVYSMTYWDVDGANPVSDTDDMPRMEIDTKQ
jgi:hypothetical protein